MRTVDRVMFYQGKLLGFLSLYSQCDYLFIVVNAINDKQFAMIGLGIHYELC